MSEVQRLDKWLWFARCARTRSAAQRLIAAGSVRLNSVRCTSNSATVRAGDVLTLNLPHGLKVYRVVETGEARQSAELAAALFEDISPEVPPSEKPVSAFEHAIRPRGAGRPTKRDRRVVDRLIRG